MTKQKCSGTVYKINGKTFCIGEKTTKIKKGKTVKLIRKTKKGGTRRKATFI